MKSDYSLNLTYKFHALNMSWYGNLDSSMVKSAKLEIWRSVVQILVQVQIFLLKI